jgi:hypothetical protein
LDAIAAALEEKEVLDEFEIEQLIGPPAHRQPSLNGKPTDGSPAGNDAGDGTPAISPIGTSAPKT